MQMSKNWIAFYTIVRKEVARIFRVWSQSLLLPIITTVLYFLVFGHVIGGRIGKMDGYQYIDFIAPGLIMLTLINASYAGSVSSFFLDKFQHSIEEILVAPVPNYVILLGYTMGGIVRGTLVAILVALVAMFFTRLPIHSAVLLLAVALLASGLFALGGVINAIFANRFDDISYVPTFVLTPLIYLGGVFYSIKLLPAFWQDVSMANPIVYIVNAFRFGFLGAGDTHLKTAFVVMIISNIALFSVALWLLNRGTRLKR